MIIRFQFAEITSLSKFFNAILFLLSGLVTGPNFMSISSLVLELWQFTFVRDWPEICKSEIPPSEFFLISGDWSKLATPNLARSSSIKCYWILKNSKVTTFTVSELLRENQHEGEVKLPPLLPTHTHIHKHTHTHTPRLGLTQKD